jgi:tRNA A-37 threonylcarbamoyl transferase component Bud32
MAPPAGDADDLASLEEHVQRYPEDGGARLRLAERLTAMGESAAARAQLVPLEADGHPLRAVALARLAALAEREGQVRAAVACWERVLADDIDDARAWAERSRLVPARTELEVGAGGGLGAAAPTLESPAGVSVSRYSIVQELGRGASATVYLARDAALGLDLALKVLHPRRGADAAEADRRFFHEARTVAGLRHAGVVAIYDIDEPARTLVMEHLPGGTLRDRLRALAPAGLAAGEALALARGLLEALAYVHGRGVVHGDLTPRNLLLRARPPAPLAPVLVDFGIARARGAEPHAVEQPAGTPLYLAPEQLRGAASSESSDLFAAGAVLWEALAGRSMRTQADLVRESPWSRPLPTAAAARAPRALVRTIELLTAAEPADRPAGAAAARALLEDPR